MEYVRLWRLVNEKKVNGDRVRVNAFRHDRTLDRFDSLPPLS